MCLCFVPISSFAASTLSLCVVLGPGSGSALWCFLWYVLVRGFVVVVMGVFVLWFFVFGFVFLPVWSRAFFPHSDTSSFGMLCSPSFGDWDGDVWSWCGDEVISSDVF